MGRLSLGGRVLTNALLSISNKYLFVMGMGPDGDYEEHLIEVSSGEAAGIIEAGIDYLTELMGVLDLLLVGLGHELGAELTLKSLPQDPIPRVINWLSTHEGYLNTLGNAWRRLLDGARIGRVDYRLRGRDAVYVIYSGNNITLNLVAEPVVKPLIELTTYTEGKATGVVRVRVGEDVVAKVDLRSFSAFTLLAQIDDQDLRNLPPQLSTKLGEAYPIIMDHVGKLMGIIRGRLSYGENT